MMRTVRAPRNCAIDARVGVIFLQMASITVGVLRTIAQPVDLFPLDAGDGHQARQTRHRHQALCDLRYAARCAENRHSLSMIGGTVCCATAHRFGSSAFLIRQRLVCAAQRYARSPARALDDRRRRWIPIHVSGGPGASYNR